MIYLAYYWMGKGEINIVEIESYSALFKKTLILNVVFIKIMQGVIASL